MFTLEISCFPILTSGCMTQVLSSTTLLVHFIAHRLHVLVMNRLHEMNVQVLLNTRIDPNSLKISPNNPCASHALMNGNSHTTNLSPSSSVSDFFKNPCSTPPPVSPHLPSFILLPPVVQTEDLPTTIITTDGRKVNADLIVGPLLFATYSPSSPIT